MENIDYILNDVSKGLDNDISKECFLRFCKKYLKLMDNIGCFRQEVEKEGGIGRNVYQVLGFIRRVFYGRITCDPMQDVYCLDSYIDWVPDIDEFFNIFYGITFADVHNHFKQFKPIKNEHIKICDSPTCVCSHYSPPYTDIENIAFFKNEINIIFSVLRGVLKKYYVDDSFHTILSSNFTKIEDLMEYIPIDWEAEVNAWMASIVKQKLFEKHMKKYMEYEK